MTASALLLWYSPSLSHVYGSLKPLKPPLQPDKGALGSLAVVHLWSQILVPAG